MKNGVLFNELRAAYTEENLNKITSRIIEIYRKKQFDYISGLMQKIEPFIYFDEKKINRVFSRLVMLYHPDKLNYYINEIEKNYYDGNESNLTQLSHIFAVLENLDTESSRRISEKFDEEFPEAFYDEAEFVFDPENFNPGFNDDLQEYDEESSGNSYHDNQELNEFEDDDFLSVLNRKEGARSGERMRYSDLEKLEGELQLNESGLFDLNGIENCKNITVLDLSDNEISDITLIGHLPLLEEIYLSANIIESVESLSELSHLKKLDLSFNIIADVSDLYNLAQLEFLNIIGNRVPDEQVAILKKHGVMVIA